MGSFRRLSLQRGKAGGLQRQEWAARAICSEVQRQRAAALCPRAVAACPPPPNPVITQVTQPHLPAVLPCPAGHDPVRVRAPSHRRPRRAVRNAAWKAAQRRLPCNPAGHRFAGMHWFGATFRSSLAACPPAGWTLARCTAPSRRAACALSRTRSAPTCAARASEAGAGSLQGGT